MRAPSPLLFPSCSARTCQTPAALRCDCRWIDLEPGELATLENQLAALPDVTSKITKFECCEWLGPNLDACSSGCFRTV